MRKFIIKNSISILFNYKFQKIFINYKLPLQELKVSYKHLIY